MDFKVKLEQIEIDHKEIMNKVRMFETKLSKMPMITETLDKMFDKFEKMEKFDKRIVSIEKQTNSILHTQFRHEK